jgi:proteasome lid subunit RPN8/RPN11
MQIRQDVLAAIDAHARSESPRECCGLLIGDADHIVEAVAANNVAADPMRRYEIAPADYFAQIRRCRELTAARGTRLAVVGAYHSHPRSLPDPSPTDLAEAFSGFLYLIIGPAERTDRPDVRAYRLTDENLIRVELVPVDVEQR